MLFSQLHRKEERQSHSLPESSSDIKSASDLTQRTVQCLVGSMFRNVWIIKQRHSLLDRNAAIRKPRLKRKLNGIPIPPVSFEIFIAAQRHGASLPPFAGSVSANKSCLALNFDMLCSFLTFTSPQIFSFVVQLSNGPTAVSISFEQQHF